MMRLKLPAWAMAVLAVWCCGAAAFGQETPAPSDAAPAVIEMQVAGDVVQVRAGPGAYYYPVAKLTEATRVQVLGTVSGWTAIKPPESVVAMMKASDVTRGEGTGGLVDATLARVYAKDPASDRTWAVIAQLAKDEAVTILRDEGDHVVVAMPEAARVYVSSTLLKPVEAPSTGTTTSTTGTGTATGGPVTITPLEIDPQTAAYEKAAELLKAECAKPLMERDYNEAEAALKAVLENATTAYLKADVEGDLATIAFHRQLRKGLEDMAADKQAIDTQLAAVRKKEEDRLSDEMALPTDTMKTPDFEGVLRPMKARMAYSYRLEDPTTGRFVCLLDADQAMMEALAGYAGKTVRVWGDKEYRVELKMNVCRVKRVEEASQQ